ncbi:PD-(D/E)XK nuclease family transposase [uncultured Roseburia sp.]|uniref:Rpn family recombination-promoting nuclease/putative transposase n=1 Tax=Brotonthovivens ammoniilytica TaxID=2981725 RepID=A0ABT2TFA2_9FIRM|nr:Rpn family recombination-promoting nuclease/putative transposase [Brotonthovivens ammoniilytica]MCU6760827.1 Rpn family recombination-promoting nuclease/putative transposase [Brotonthovivens ammoniilytica]SCI10542.1 PD-(D/E)XK nuclease family transposase [uncultured Roseburia sp.]
MKKRKKFQELEYTDAFLFAAVMEDEEICREVLQVILGKSVESIKVEVEKSLLVNSDCRGIRMDVCLTGDDSVYNIEMQTTNQQDLPYRSRFYQSQLDAAALRPGDPFINLPKSLIIFICTFDPFGMKRCVYTFEERCLEEDIALENGTRKIFLNAQGNNLSDVSESLADFLRYVDNPFCFLPDRANSSVAGLVRERIQNLKQSRRWEEKYMRFEEILANERKEALEEGIIQGQIQGQEQIRELFACLISQNRYEDLKKAAEDQEYLHEMFREFHL